MNNAGSEIFNQQMEELGNEYNKWSNAEKISLIKSNESLADNKIKSETEQLLAKYKHGNNIHEYRKQQNK